MQTRGGYVHGQMPKNANVICEGSLTQVECFILVPLRDVVTTTAELQLTRFYRGNCYLYQTQGAYNTGMLDIVFYVTSMPRSFAF